MAESVLAEIGNMVTRLADKSLRTAFNETRKEFAQATEKAHEITNEKAKQAVHQGPPSAVVQISQEAQDLAKQRSGEE